MQSLIARQPKDTRKQTTVSLSGSVLRDLELYCRFIDSARDWVINEALKSIFQRDRAFVEWRERQKDLPIPAPAASSSNAPASTTAEITHKNERPR